MGVAKVTNNLVGSSHRAKFPAVQGAALSVNMYYSKNGGNEYMESLPGLKLLSVVNSGKKCRGAYVSTVGLKANGSPEDMFSVFGNKLYRIDTFGNSVEIGYVANNGLRISFAETGGPRALLLVCDGLNLFYYDLLEGGPLVAIQMPDRPFGDGGNVVPSSVAVVAGSIVVNDKDSGYLYYSKPYPLAADTREVFDLDAEGQTQYSGVNVQMKTVDAAEYCFLDDYGLPQYFNTESSSDNVSAIYAVGPALYLFGTKTVEIWQRGSGEFEDWIRTSYTAQNSFGIEAPGSVASSGSIVYFVASGAQYGKCVMMAQGTQFKKISEDWLDEKLLKESTSTAYGFCYSVGEHNFYVLQLESLNETWVYDTLDNGWHKRTSVKKDGLEGAWRAGALAYYGEKFYGLTNDGTVCMFGDYWQEDMPDGSHRQVIRHRSTPVIVDNERPFIVEEIAIECNVGSVPNYADEPKVMLEISKDGGNTFGNMRSVSFGRTGQYSHRVRFLNIGMCRKCVMRVTFSAPCELVLNFCSIRAESTGAMI